MKNLILICFAGSKTNGSLSGEEIRRLKKVTEDLKTGHLSRFIGPKNTTIYCGSNEEEDHVLQETLRILNPKDSFSLGGKKFTIRKIKYLSRRDSGRSVSKQSYFVNDHLKKVYFSKKNIPPEIVLMNEDGMKNILSHLTKTNGPGYSCPEEFITGEMPVGTVVKIRVPQKEIEAVIID